MYYKTDVITILLDYHPIIADLFDKHNHPPIKNEAFMIILECIFHLFELLVQ